MVYRTPLEEGLHEELTGIGLPFIERYIFNDISSRPRQLFYIMMEKTAEQRFANEPKFHRSGLLVQAITSTNKNGIYVYYDIAPGVKGEEKLKNAKSSEIPEIVDRMLLDRYFFREEVAIFKYLRRFPEDKEDELLFGLSLIQNEELKNRDMTPPYFKYGRLQMFFKDINLSSPDCMLDKANQIAKAVSRLVLEGGNTAII
ncbi:hypothetical protein J4225_00895 [Candidatus Pacearchaeota archaeon]|nr:hypothetical protein [Candidatus Pacearchaeota archaeon]